MPKTQDEIRVNERSPLKWAEGWTHTPIGDRKPMKAWKKPFAYYRDALIEQLRKVGATEILISYNEGDDARRDPGVTVYFSKPLREDFSWQLGLGIDNPAPTLAEIDAAYRRKVQPVHPDRPENAGGDVEMYLKLGNWREQAKAWVLDTHRSEHDFALPCDRFTEPRWNLNALKLGIAALRRLEDYGLPGMLERTFRGLRVQLAEHAGTGGSDVKQAVNS